MDQKQNQNSQSSYRRQPLEARRYDNISLDARLNLIKRVTEKKTTIKKACEDLGIKISTAKVILKIFRQEGRIGKKKTRQYKSFHESKRNLGNGSLPTLRKLQIDEIIKDGNQGMTDNKIREKSSKNEILDLTLAIEKYNQQNKLLQNLIQRLNQNAESLDFYSPGLKRNTSKVLQDRPILNEKRMPLGFFNQMGIYESDDGQSSYG